MIRNHFLKSIFAGLSVLALATLFVSCDPHKWEGEDGVDELFEPHHHGHGGDHKEGEDHKDGDDHKGEDHKGKDGDHKGEEKGKGKAEKSAEPRSAF